LSSNDRSLTSRRFYVQCSDDSNGTRPCFDSSGKGRLLRELRNSLDVGLATLRALRIRADRSIGSPDPRAVGPESNSSSCPGRIVGGFASTEEEPPAQVPPGCSPNSYSELVP
jgi:hypothetical protein